MSSEKIIVLYERLSREDENLGESYSISNQKKLLEDYCREKGWTRFRHFTDDGISGTTFDRPSFKAMIQLVEDGEVETIILKDMSRLGRDYLVVGQLREFFRKKGVRLIAINDNHDSYNGDDDFLVFRDVMNEMYAKDISKKIKSTFKSKGKSGKHVASVTPYGYLKDENDGNHWIVDEEAAEIVRLIFKWTIDGLGPYQIAKLLQEKKVEIPAVHMARFGQGNNRNKKVKDPYGWGSSTVVGILKKREYLGHTVNFKTQKHFKDKKSHYVSEDNWVIFENTQEPIIDQQTFDTVQVAMQYGIKINRSGLACCPFHKDKTPSMKIDKRYYCFGCGDTGDAIDFVAKYFGLAPKEAAMKIASDFGLNYDATNRAPPKKMAPKKTPEQILDEEQKQCFCVLSDYYHLLRKWKTEYAPKSMDEEWHPCFVEALQNISKVEYQLDTLLEKDIPDRASVVSDIGKGVKSIAGRIEEYRRSQGDAGEHRKGRSQENSR